MGKYMGKYMKKSKIRGDIVVMEVSPSTIGVCTRAKTLALRRLLQTEVDETSFCYLQLRSRRLEKSPPPSKQQKEKEKSCRGEKQNHDSKPNSRSGVLLGNSDKVGSYCDKNEMEDVNGVAVEASFGENSLDFELKDRTTREGTPCSLIRASDSIGTPGSAAKLTNSTAYQGVISDGNSSMPVAQEIEEFFACAEKQQKRSFIEKYNFDIVNDLPLSGRYEWVKVVP